MLGVIALLVGLFVFVVGGYLDIKTTSQFDGKYVFEANKLFKRADGTASIKKYIVLLAVQAVAISVPIFAYRWAGFLSAAGLIFLGVGRLKAASHNQELLNKRKKEHGF
jgi:hypothetical protein